MRFWQKIFLLTLVILLISLNIFSYVFVRNNLNASLSKEIKSCLDEYKIIYTSFQTNLIYQKYISGKTKYNRTELLSVFMDFTKTPIGNSLQYEYLPDAVPSAANRAEVTIAKENSKDVLYISAVFLIEDYSFRLTTDTDISNIYETASQQISFAKNLSLIVSLVTAVITLIMSLFLTYRINALRRSTQKMSHGIFFMRAKVSSHDEVGELAHDFNTMAATVESKVAELSQIAADRKRFIDNIAHEMKTPLTSIIGFADLLKNAKIDNKTKVEYADNIYREGKHLKNVSSKLMELILLGKTNPTMDDADVESFLDEIYQTMEQICINAGITLVLQKNHIPHLINMDTELMKSLLYNLIDNAVKASKQGGRIIISSAFTKSISGQKNFYISVKDFGRGIPSDEVAKITEPFYMLDKARTREHGGAGLGLALCSEIATLHNAELIINSVLGEFTEIKILFHKGDTKNETKKRV